MSVHMLVNVVEVDQTLLLIVSIFFTVVGNKIII